jgi:UrcA family protein
MPRYMNLKTVIPCTLLALSLGPLSSVAAAIERGDDPPARTVDFADLNLSSSAGAAVLYARIKSAAAEVCEPVNARALESFLSAKRCAEQSIARAVAYVNAPALTSLHLAKKRTIIVAQRR